MPSRGPAPNLASRLGQDVVRERGGVRYLDLDSRNLVNRCDSPRVPFRWTVNPYRGCALGCRYCYAAYTHEFLGRDAASEFASTIYAKRGGLEEAAHALQTAARRGELVALGTATDPYQPAEASFGVTRRFLELAAGIRGLRLALTTKAALVLRDLDLLRRLDRRGSLSVNVSLVSLDAALLRRLEPWAPPPEARIQVMRRLVAVGLRVSHSLAPLLPGLTDAETDLDALLAAVAGAGVRRSWANLLFLRSPTRERFLGWLREAVPERLPEYARAYRRGAYLGRADRERILARVDRARARHGLRGPHALDEWAAGAGTVQLRLWD
jgi:DNA repair photolyase